MTPGREDLIVKMIDDFRQEVRAEFTVVKQKQDYTNGDVRDLKLWRAKIEGAFATARYGHPLAVGLVVAGFTFGLTRIFG